MAQPGPAARVRREALRAERGVRASCDCSLSCRSALAIAALVLLGPVVAGAEGTGCSLAPGDSVQTLEVDGSLRRFQISVGSRAGARPPLVFVWHGWGGTPSGLMQVFAPARFWPEAIVVAPEGMARTFPGLSSASRLGFQIALGEFGDRDLKLFDAIVELLGRQGCSDPTRIYSTGFSNGGFFSNLLGCQRAGVLAAIAPVSGGGPRERSCNGPVPVMITHGRADDVVPYREGERSFQSWRSVNACESSGDAAADSCLGARDCVSETRFCSHGGGHRWPHGAAQRIAGFFQAHRR